MTSCSTTCGGTDWPDAMDEASVISLRQAQALVDARRWSDARDLLGPLVAERPDDARARCLLAVCLLNLDDPGGAMRQAEDAAAAAPTMEWPHRLRAAALLRLDVPHHAMKAAREAERVAPSNPWVQITLTDAALACGDVAAAGEAALRAQQLAPTLAPAHVAMGNVWLRLQQPRSAERHFREALRLDPENAIAMNNLGVALKGQGKHAGAMGSYSEAARLDPRLHIARTNAVALLGADAIGTCFLASVVALAVVLWVGGPLVPAIVGLAIVWVPALVRRMRRWHGTQSAGAETVLPTAEVMRRLRAEARRPSWRSLAPRLFVFGLVLVCALSFELVATSLEPPSREGLLFGAWMAGCAALFVGGFASKRLMLRR